MAVLCYLIGAIMLLGFSGAGYFVGKWILGYPVILNMTTMNDNSIWAFVGVGVGIGVILCLNWVVLGLNCRSIRELKQRR